MDPIHELVSEHEAVLTALQILDRVERGLTAGAAGAGEDLGQLLDFFKGFVDRCHHAKEEDVLFPELQRRGLTQEGQTVGELLSEHEEGRACIRGMAEGLARLRRGEPGALETIRQNARRYRELLQEHIETENSDVFPLAGQLPQGAADDMAQRFEQIERERVGPGKHEAYHAMLHSLREKYQV